MAEKFECNSCGATGLYKGFAEPKGTAVVCSTCGGKGYISNGKTIFSGVKKKDGISRVFYDNGMWFARSENAPTISIQEFERVQSQKSNKN